MGGPRAKPHYHSVIEKGGVRLNAVWKLYELIGQRKIESVSLRERGQIRGTRVFSAEGKSCLNRKLGGGFSVCQHIHAHHFSDNVTSLRC